MIYRVLSVWLWFHGLWLCLFRIWGWGLICIFGSLCNYTLVPNRAHLFVISSCTFRVQMSVFSSSSRKCNLAQLEATCHFPLIANTQGGCVCVKSSRAWSSCNHAQFMPWCLCLGKEKKNKQSRNVIIYGFISATDEYTSQMKTMLVVLLQIKCNKRDNCACIGYTFYSYAVILSFFASCIMGGNLITQK